MRMLSGRVPAHQSRNMFRGRTNPSSSRYSQTRSWSRPMNVPFAHCLVPTCELLVDRSVGPRFLDELIAAVGDDFAVSNLRVRQRRYNGVDLVRALRETKFNAAIIVLGRLESADQRIAFFDSGADHVLDLPIATLELVSWIRSIQRRISQLPAPCFWAEGLGLRWEEHTVEWEDRRITLTVMEFELVAVLARCAGAVVSRRHLLLAVWGLAHEVTTNVLNAHMWSLRRKLASIGARHLVHTVHKVGFVLRQQRQPAD
ncbi:MAG: response regulator transcription factor [Alcaligenaceae bacterium]|nr:MAG: response regulator transcription factor [Alcaligenaceae bacterium]